MLCNTCGTPYGEVDMATSDKKPPTWVCVNGHRQAWGEEPSCLCRHCSQQGPLPQRMVVCGTCGNKRCPHAEWHGYKCTGSNEPNQTPEVVRPAWIDAAAEEIDDGWNGVATGGGSHIAEIIEKHWRTNK